VKQFIKREGIRFLQWMGPRLPTAAARRWICDNVVPFLMDPEVLPQGLVLRPLKHIPVAVLCNPYVYVHRNGYWCGVFFEEELEAYMRRELKPGDTVIDVGANVGHVAIPAASLIGPRGRVIAFEPNRELASQLATCAAEQRLNVEMRPYGLGEEAGVFTLRMEPDHAGGATFRELADPGFTKGIECRIEVGDEVMPILSGRVFLKIDVEGFELNVLCGLRQTLPKIDHAVLEVSPGWLGKDGVRTLFDVMGAAGMASFEIALDGSIGPSLRPGDVTSQKNVLFKRRGFPLTTALASSASIASSTGHGKATNGDARYAIPTS
jgi:FkbM family methyltransferase